MSDLSEPLGGEAERKTHRRTAHLLAPVQMKQIGQPPAVPSAPAPVKKAARYDARMSKTKTTWVPSMLGAAS